MIYIFTVVLTGIMLFLVSSGESAIVNFFNIFLLIGLWKPEFVLPTYFIASLSSNYFMAGEGLGFTRLLALIIIGGVVFRLVRRKQQLRKKWVIHCIVMAVVTLVSFLQSLEPDINVMYVFGLNVLVFIAIANLSITQDELAHLFGALMIAVLLTSIFFAVQITLNPQFVNYGRLTIDQGVNENRFGIMMAQLSAASLGYMVFSRKMMVKVVCFILGVINAYYVLLSGSRSALIGIVIGFVITSLLVMIVEKRASIRFAGSVILFGGVAIIFYLQVLSDSMLLRRMDIEQIVSTGGTERLPRIMAALEYVIPNNPFFGVGPSSNDEYLALNKVMSFAGSSHNFIISLLTQMGMFGFFAYSSFFWNVVREAIGELSNKKITVIPLMLILVSVANGIGEIIFPERFFWNALALAALCQSTIFANSIVQVAAKKNQVSN